jgi:hypothetical protein
MCLFKHRQASSPEVYLVELGRCTPGERDTDLLDEGSPATLCSVHILLRSENRPQVALQVNVAQPR